MSEPNDHEWILLRERGDDVSHIPASTRAKYDELARLFAALPGETPSLGWKQRILAALDEPLGQDTSATGPDEPPAQDGTAAPDGPPVRDISTARRHRPRLRIWAIAAGLTTMASIALVFALCQVRTIEHGRDGVVAPYDHDADERRPRVAEVHVQLPKYTVQGAETPLRIASDLGVTTEIRSGNKPHRSGSGSGSVSIGDTLVVHVNVAPPFELRAYGDTGEPLVRCTEMRGCVVEHHGNVRRFRLELELQASGDVHAVLFLGASIPVAFQNLNADVEAAHKAGVDARQIEVIHVQ